MHNRHPNHDFCGFVPRILCAQGGQGTVTFPDISLVTRWVPMLVPTTYFLRDALLPRSCSGIGSWRRISGELPRQLDSSLSLEKSPGLFTLKTSDWISPQRFAKRKINPAVFLRRRASLRLPIEKQCIFVNFYHFIRDFPYVHLALTG